MTIVNKQNEDTRFWLIMDDEQYKSNASQTCHWKCLSYLPLENFIPSIDKLNLWNLWLINDLNCSWKASPWLNGVYGSLFNILSCHTL